MQRYIKHKPKNYNNAIIRTTTIRTVREKPVGLHECGHQMHVGWKFTKTTKKKMNAVNSVKVTTKQTTMCVPMKCAATTHTKQCRHAWTINGLCRW